MAIENREMSIGWPLGLGNLNMRLRQMVEVAEVQPRSLYVPSSSFSSFSSSNLDTESTVSFFQDNSRSLGRLIGLKPGNGRDTVYLCNSIRMEEGERFRHSSSQGHKMEVSNGICLPLYVILCYGKDKRK
ncbi:hypothetical protein Ancab_033874 [Ancistrocladus abbreviatus]